MVEKNLLLGCILSFSAFFEGCSSTAFEHRIEMFREGEHLIENWPWITKPEVYLNDRNKEEIYKVLFSNCVHFRYSEDDLHFVSLELAKELREKYRKESEEYAMNQ